MPNNSIQRPAQPAAADAERYLNDDRHQFAALVLASQLGGVSKQEVIARADQRIMEVDQPEYLLIELSSDGYSSELGPLIDGADDTVYGEVLRMVLGAWIEKVRLLTSGLWRVARRSGRRPETSR